MFRVSLGYQRNGKEALVIAIFVPRCGRLLYGDMFPLGIRNEFTYSAFSSLSNDTPGPSDTPMILIFSSSQVAECYCQL